MTDDPFKPGPIAAQAFAEIEPMYSAQREILLHKLRAGEISLQVSEPALATAEVKQRLRDCEHALVEFLETALGRPSAGNQT